MLYLMGGQIIRSISVHHWNGLTTLSLYFVSLKAKIGGSNEYFSTFAKLF
jgi:hypothetical protein